MADLPQIPAVLDLAGTAVFALTGALLAAKLRQTFVTMSFFALITGVGGGSVRDLLIGAPVFWVRDPWVAPVCLGVALIAWFTPHRWWEGKLLDWADALGLAAYAVLGTAKALAFAIAPVPAVLMGVITGCVGGVIRDVLAGRPSIIMRPEIYVTAAALASVLCALGTGLGWPREIAWTGAALAGFVLRGYAISRGLGLPSYSKAD
ncbi:trimeric intracellular cation channel family protein [Novosphingobium sp.]|uniref:trimeric intracellular cation channel family protein n=1 Tax=Novosphingobium sp. TaxID=1874826 RepID=UPI0025D7795B|nr:trimeric intracellular cation channel family protein [Novosphingobium sp.]MCC6924878.1 trimeric intracellular cation channel family protein [Novosphingobium sp.]